MIMNKKNEVCVVVIDTSTKLELGEKVTRRYKGQEKTHWEQEQASTMKLKSTVRKEPSGARIMLVKRCSSSWEEKLLD